MPEEQDAPLSTEDIAQIEKLFGNPLYFPTRFKSWLPDYVAQQIPQLPIVQSLGGRGVPRYLGVSASSQTVSGTSAATTVFTQKVPAKTVAQNGRLSCRLDFTVQSPDVTNIVDISFFLGGTKIGGLIEVDTTYIDGTARPGWAEVVMVNAGAYTSQHTDTIGGFIGEDGRFQMRANAYSTSIATDEDQDFTAVVQWGSAGGSSIFVKKYASLEVFNPIGF